MVSYQYLAVVLTALATGWNAHENGFVWDDRAAVIGNYDVRLDLSNSTIFHVFQHDFWGDPIHASTSHKSYRPVTVLTFRWNFLHCGVDPRCYHSTNTLLHASCSLLVLILASRIFSLYDSPKTKQRPQAILGPVLAGLLFAVHPIHCDAVASIVGRADLLCANGTLLAFLLYMEACKASSSHDRTFLGLSIGIAFIGSLCKELGFTAFGLFLAYDILLQFTPNHSDKQDFYRRTSIVFLFAVVWASLRVWINGDDIHMQWPFLSNNIALEDSKLTRMLSYAHVHAWYLYKLVWPYTLSYDYGFDTIPIISSVSDPLNTYTCIAYSSLLTGIMIGCIFISTSPILLCIALGAIPFVPASHVLFPVGTIVAERLMYLPSVGFCLLVSHLLQRAYDRTCLYATSPSFRKKHMIFAFASHFVPFACTLLLVSAYFRSRSRNADWKDEQTLFASALKAYPTNVKVLSNVGKTLLGKAPEKAVAYLKLSVAMLPHYVEGHVNLGLAYGAIGHELLAMRHLIKASEFGPKRFLGPGYLGVQILDYWTKQRTQIYKDDVVDSLSVHIAKRYLDEAIARGSIHPTHYFSRASIAYYEKNYEDSIMYFDATCQANAIVSKRNVDTQELLLPELNIRSLIFKSYRALGQLDEALAAAEDAIQLYPTAIQLRLNAALIYHEQGQLEHAMVHIRQTVALATRQDVTALVEANKAFNARQAGDIAEAMCAKAMAVAADSHSVQLTC